MRRYCKVLLITLIVILNYLDKTVLLEYCAARIINVRVEKAGCFQLRYSLFNKSVILDSFGNTARCKDSVKLAVTAQDFPTVRYILNYLLAMLRRLILSVRDITSIPLIYLPSSALKPAIFTFEPSIYS